MMRMTLPLSVWTTTKSLWFSEYPRVTSLSSASEWSGSGIVEDPKSEKTVFASQKEMWCFFRFSSAFRLFHSNSTSFYETPDNSILKFNIEVLLVSIPFKRESGSQVSKSKDLRNLQTIRVSIPFKRESGSQDHTWKQKPICYKCFNSLQTGKRITSYLNF